jgi:hypothetical protein
MEMDKQYGFGHVAWAWIYSMDIDMYHGHGHASWA